MAKSFKETWEASKADMQQTQLKNAERKEATRQKNEQRKADMHAKLDTMKQPQSATGATDRFFSSFTKNIGGFMIAFILLVAVLILWAIFVQ